MDIVNGIKIVSHRESLEPVFSFFGLEYDDPALLTAAGRFLREASSNADVGFLRGVLWERSPGFMGLWGACARHSSREWIGVYSSFLLHVVSTTTDLDHEIKRLLLGEQLISDVVRTSEGRRALNTILDLRGFDFFLSYYFCGEVEGGFLIDFSTEHLDVALRSEGRVERADTLQADAEARKKGLASVGGEGGLANLRADGERAWYDYLGHETWRMLARESRTELTEAFVIQAMIERRFLRDWAPVALALTKVIEAELAVALLRPWKPQFARAEFIEVPTDSRREKDRISWRKTCFDLLKRYGQGGAEPTLGQMQALSGMLDDPLMDRCTTLFAVMRASLGESAAPFLARVEKLFACFKEKVEGKTLVDLRNASAHPRRGEHLLDWRPAVGWLRDLLGTPPAELLSQIREVRRLTARQEKASAETT